jgi:hypothetical protein
MSFYRSSAATATRRSNLDQISPSTKVSILAVEEKVEEI